MCSKCAVHCLPPRHRSVSTLPSPRPPRVLPKPPSPPAPLSCHPPLVPLLLPRPPPRPPRARPAPLGLARHDHRSARTKTPSRRRPPPPFAVGISRECPHLTPHRFSGQVCLRQQNRRRWLGVRLGRGAWVGALHATTVVACGGAQRAGGNACGRTLRPPIPTDSTAPSSPCKHRRRPTWQATIHV